MVAKELRGLMMIRVPIFLLVCIGLTAVHNTQLQDGDSFSQAVQVKEMTPPFQ